jgi:hypothetical protein
MRGQPSRNSQSRRKRAEMLKVLEGYELHSMFGKC